MKDHFSVILNFLAMGLIVYVYVRWLREPKEQKAAEMPPSASKNKNIPHVMVSILIAGIIVGTVYFVPEWLGRRDATSVCGAISVGTKFPFDQESLNAYRNEQKSKYGSLFAANYYPKIKGVEDGAGAIILVFLAGYPFSRAYCVVNLNNGLVESTKLMFNAEDYEYCNGEMRGVWECSEGNRL